MASGIDWESILPTLAKRDDIGVKIKSMHVAQCDDSKCAYHSFSFVAGAINSSSNGTGAVVPKHSFNGCLA